MGTVITVQSVPFKFELGNWCGAEGESFFTYAIGGTEQEMDREARSLAELIFPQKAHYIDWGARHLWEFVDRSKLNGNWEADELRIPAGGKSIEVDYSHPGDDYGIWTVHFGEVMHPKEERFWPDWFTRRVV